MLVHVSLLCTGVWSSSSSFSILYNIFARNLWSFDIIFFICFDEIKYYTCFVDSRTVLLKNADSFWTGESYAQRFSWLCTTFWELCFQLGAQLSMYFLHVKSVAFVCWLHCLALVPSMQIIICEVCLSISAESEHKLNAMDRANCAREFLSSVNISVQSFIPSI